MCPFYYFFYRPAFAEACASAEASAARGRLAKEEKENAEKAQRKYNEMLEILAGSGFMNYCTFVL